MKYFYEYASITPHNVDARKSDGRKAAQIRRAFKAPSVAAAIRMIDEYGYTRNYIKDYTSVEDKPLPRIPLDDYEDGTILIAPLDPGDTIDGTTGWRPWSRD